MQPLVLVAEVMDKEPSLVGIWLFCGVFAGLGYVLAGWKPWALGLVAPAALIVAWAELAELHDPYVGPAIRSEAGLGYVGQAHVALLLVVVVPLLGAVVSVVSEQQSWAALYRAGEAAARTPYRTATFPPAPPWWTRHREFLRRLTRAFILVLAGLVAGLAELFVVLQAVMYEVRASYQVSRCHRPGVDRAACLPVAEHFHRVAVGYLLAGVVGVVVALVLARRQRSVR